MYKMGWKIINSNKKRYCAVLLLLSAVLALFLIQLSVLFHRTYQSASVIEQMPHVSVWVMHPHVQGVDDRFPLSLETQNTLQSIEGIRSVSPLIMGSVTAALAKGKRQQCHLVGSSPRGCCGPQDVLMGHPCSLEHARTLFVDKQALSQLYAQRGFRKGKGKLGAHLKVNDRVLRVVGLFDRKQRSAMQPLLYTNLAQARELLHVAEDCTLYFGVSLVKGADSARICQQIMRNTGLKAITSTEFIANHATHYLQQEHTMRYFWALVGSALLIASALLIYMVRHFGVLLGEHLLSFRAMGASVWHLLQITLLHSCVIAGGSWLLGILWYGIFAGIFQMAPAFSLIANQLYFGALGVLSVITVLASSLSVGNFLRTEEELIYKL